MAVSLQDAGRALRRPVRWPPAVGTVRPPRNRVLRLLPQRPPRNGARRLLWNLRAGRMQKTLAATTAASALPLGFEMYLEHYKGSFGDAWMWSPILTSPLLTGAGALGLRSRRAARSVLPAVSLLYAINGAIGTVTHLRGVKRKPGGFSEPTYNLVMGPPLLAPGSLVLVGLLGILAGLVQRER